ncbi:response regulator [Propionispora vibrioides]|jgi:DNA-binding NtrC family response regulator|uniref:Response regulator receiver domain-containing protein n=1 Tax=Propionispora vibrioides TaxID=112903 RepID=A0A1H8WVT7_9FIRM|nr:response regulator [Propionispora vibrioides]SEP31719.1 Response regulator receiver domain-containing protein [Propionispora vibrioides]
MYKIGFIDDDKSLIDDYKIRLKRKGIELLFVEVALNKEDVVKWILGNGVKCMLVDYKLTEMYDFNGTELVAYINSQIPDLPCIILTNYCDEGISENLVIKNLFMEREKLDADIDSPDFEEMINIFKQAVEVFDNRLKYHQTEFESLKLKKDNNDINSNEEERLIELFKILRAYDEVDDLPAELLTTNASKKMSDILHLLDKLIDKTE